MKSRQGFVAAGMVVALGIPGAATATPADTFRGAWTSVDVDGSSQLL